MYNPFYGEEEKFLFTTDVFKTINKKSQGVQGPDAETIKFGYGFVNLYFEDGSKVMVDLNGPTIEIENISGWESVDVGADVMRRCLEGWGFAF